MKWFRREEPDPERDALWQRIHDLQLRLGIDVPRASGDIRHKDWVLLQMIVLERMMLLIEEREREQGRGGA